LPVLKVRAAQAMVRDVALFFVFGLLVIGAVLAGAFRSVRGVALPLGAVSIGLVWTSATMTMAGDAFTLGTLVLPPLLLSVGIAYAIHVMSRYEIERTLGGTADTVVRRTLRHVRVPIVMAALTTLAGFAAFLGNPIPTIRDFGWYAIVGLACVLAATLTALPAALVLARTTAGPPPAGAFRWIDPLVLACTRVALRHPRAVILWAGAITVVAALGIGRIDVETDYLRFFAPEHPARRDNARVANELVGTQLVALTLSGERPEALTRLDVLTALADLVAFVGAQPGVGHVTSYLDHLRMLRQAVEPEQADTPLRDQRAVDQRMALLNPESMRRVLDAAHSEGQVVVYTRLSGSGEIRALVRRIEDWTAAHLPASIDARASGTLVLLTDSADTLARQQIAGLGQVLVVLTLLLAGLFRSLRLGLLAMVPNVFPVVVLFGIMGWTGIDLDVSTSMIACIAIGIAVDDTIHYVTTYEARRGREEDTTTMIEHTVRTVGRPIALTSVALGLGFLVPCLSTFQPVRHFGVLASATMVVALLADLLLLPALLVSWRVPARGARP
jgi:predicted RND superfamily exporter protein